MYRFLSACSALSGRVPNVSWRDMKFKRLKNSEWYWFFCFCHVNIMLPTALFQILCTSIFKCLSLHLPPSNWKVIWNDGIGYRLANAAPHLHKVQQSSTFSPASLIYVTTCRLPTEKNGTFRFARLHVFWACHPACWVMMGHLHDRLCATVTEVLGNCNPAAGFNYVWKHSSFNQRSFCLGRRQLDRESLRQR